ncbi:MAG: pentapeptide repeat-containing protein [Lysobacterales bacterium]
MKEATRKVWYWIGSHSQALIVLLTGALVWQSYDAGVREGRRNQQEEMLESMSVVDTISRGIGRLPGLAQVDGKTIRSSDVSEKESREDVKFLIDESAVAYLQDLEVIYARTGSRTNEFVDPSRKAQAAGSEEFPCTNPSQPEKNGNRALLSMKSLLEAQRASFDPSVAGGALRVLGFARFEDVNFTNAKLWGLSFTDSDFRAVNLDAANFDYSTLNEVCFGASITKATLKDTILNKVTISGNSEKSVLNLGASAIPHLIIDKITLAKGSRISSRERKAKISCTPGTRSTNRISANFVGLDLEIAGCHVSDSIFDSSILRGVVKNTTFESTVFRKGLGRLDDAENLTFNLVAFLEGEGISADEFRNIKEKVRLEDVFMPQELVNNHQANGLPVCEETGAVGCTAGVIFGLTAQQDEVFIVSKIVRREKSQDKSTPYQILEGEKFEREKNQVEKEFCASHEQICTDGKLDTSTQLGIKITF